MYHPSDENYLAIAGGDTYARGAIYWPDIKDPHRNLGDELQARSMSWMAYEQGMGYRCNDRASTEFRYDKYYYPDDAPFINYTDVSASRARCKAHLVSTRLLRPALLNASTTPVFSWIAADDYYDGESAGNGDRHSREVQDGWLQRTIGPILASPAWRTQKSLLIITWDEAGVTRRTTEAGNRVATIVVGSPGTVRAATSARSATTTTRPPAPSRKPSAWPRSPRTTSTRPRSTTCSPGGAADPRPGRAPYSQRMRFATIRTPDGRPRRGSTATC